jgi:hypothetical protein
MAHYRERISTGKRQKYMCSKNIRQVVSGQMTGYKVMWQLLEKLVWQAIDAPTFTRWKLRLGLTTKAAKDMAKIAIRRTMMLKRLTITAMSFPLCITVFSYAGHDFATLGLNRP